MRKIPVISWVAAGRWTETGETFLEEDVIEQQNGVRLKD
jgi:SOS-response transcriptional repressor LexA